MTITVYRSTDASAPTLNNTAGSLIGVLDACLVNGYGSKSAAGWTKEYSGTNLAAYRMSAFAPATGMYLRIDDTGTTSARGVGYETMSDVNTGTGSFPTQSQFSGGIFINKSSDSTAKAWIIIASNRSFYFINNFSEGIFLPNPSTNDRGIFFGDIVSRKEVDGYECMFIGADTTSPTSGYIGAVQQIDTAYSTTSGHFIARSYLGLGTSLRVTKGREYFATNNSSFLGGNTQTYYPNLVNNSMNLARVVINETTSIIRGYLPGFYEILGGTNTNLILLQEFVGTGTLTNKDFIVVPTSASGGSGICAIQTNGSWY